MKIVVVSLKRLQAWEGIKSPKALNQAEPNVVFKMINISSHFFFFLSFLFQPELQIGDGPIGVVCVPTRELALQIYTEAKKVAKLYNLSVVCAYGGGSMWEQQKACEAGCEILICTPVSSPYFPFAFVGSVLKAKHTRT